jgi:glyceraldehyde-3-phosphate dehydrogenase (NAD(P))
MANVVHVVGTGTIGEPIVGLLAKNKAALGIDEVTFYKHSPRKEDRPMVNALRGMGAKLAVADDKRAEFEKIGLAPDLSQKEALERARVVIDCTPEDSGLENKENVYSKLAGDKLFMAQGSEEGFGAMYALGINDDAVDPARERFVHVVSCNTHTTVRLVHALTDDGANLEEGRLVLIRRAGDVGDAKFIQAPTVEKHKEARGTHHAQDAANLYKSTLHKDVNLFSSAMKLNTQFMHTAHFHFRLKAPTTLDDVKKLLKGDRYVGLTDKTATNLVFSFAREHGPFGRILSQTVVVTPSLHVSENGKDVTGYAFTPQDGNALLSSIAMATRKLHPEDWKKRMSVFDPYLLKEY